LRSIDPLARLSRTPDRGIASRGLIPHGYLHRILFGRVLPVAAASMPVLMRAVLDGGSLSGTSLVKCRGASWGRLMTWRKAAVTWHRWNFAPGSATGPSRSRRLESSVMSAVVRAGLVPHSYLLTRRGRRTGRDAEILSWSLSMRGGVGWLPHMVRCWVVAATHARTPSGRWSGRRPGCVYCIAYASPKSAIPLGSARLGWFRNAAVDTQAPSIPKWSGEPIDIESGWRHGEPALSCAASRPHAAAGRRASCRSRWRPR
jgi:hypothetical protein